MSGYNKADSLKKFNVTFDGERDGKSFGIKGDATAWHSKLSILMGM